MTKLESIEITPQKTMEDWVWFYYKRGFTPIPIKKGTKRPNIGSWKEWHYERPKEEQIKEWLSRGLYEDVALICGRAHGNLAVIDIDDKTIVDDIGLDLQELISHGFWVEETKKGYHLFLTDLGNPGGSRLGGGTKIDFLSNGRYVVVYPSGDRKFLHAELNYLIEHESWFIYDNLRSEIIKKRTIKFTPTEEIKDAEDIDPQCISTISKGVDEGKRNESAFVLAQYYHYIKKLTKINIYPILNNWNEKNKPPMDETELVTTIDSAIKSNKSGCNKLRDLNACPFPDKKECKFYQPDTRTRKELLKEYGVFDEKGKINIVQLARLILAELPYNFTTIDDATGKKSYIYYYKDGYYHQDGETRLAQVIIHYLGKKWRTYHKNEIIEFIRVENIKKRSKLEPPLHLINVNNGIYDLKNKILLSHDPNYYFLNKIPIDYNPSAKCPEIMKFFKQILLEDYIPFMQEIFGYSLYRDYSKAAIFLFYGTGGNGKSVCEKLIAGLVGDEQVCNTPMHKIANNRFAAASLYGKLVNMAGELSEKRLQDTTLIKSLSGNDRIEAEFKGKDAFSFQNYAKVISSCNKIPYANDKSLGWYDRIYIIPFLERFREEKKEKTNLATELTQNKEELEGLLLWAMKGLERFFETGKFSFKRNEGEPGEEYDKYRMNSKWFILTHLELALGGDNFVTKKDLMNRYTKWCKETNMPVESENAVGRNMTYSNYPRKRVKDGDKGWRMAFGNVKWKEEPDTWLDEEKQRYEKR